MKVIKLPEEIKKKLGYIIHNTRLMKYKEITDVNNPYTKEKLCENICHYHTLTKMETEVINQNLYYYQILDKLGLKFNYNEYIKNTEIINKCLTMAMRSVEYIDDELGNKIIEELEKLSEDDCISDVYKSLFKFLNQLHFIGNIKTEFVNLIESYLDFYEGNFKALAYLCMGIYNINLSKFTIAQNYLEKSKEIFETNDYYSKGLINSHFLTIYRMRNEYLKLITLSHEMEEYYFINNNSKRLLHVYTYLIDYFQLINSYEEAKKYYRLTCRVIELNHELARYRFFTEYNYGISCMDYYNYDEAKDHFEQSYQLVANNNYKLQVINKLLILYTILKYDEENIRELIEEGKKYQEISIYTEQMLFKYFLYKYESKYYRKFTTDKLIPFLKQNPARINNVIFIYQDMYEKAFTK